MSLSPRALTPRAPGTPRANTPRRDYLFSSNGASGAVRGGGRLYSTHSPLAGYTESELLWGS